MKIDLGWYFQQ